MAKTKDPEVDPATVIGIQPICCACREPHADRSFYVVATGEETVSPTRRICSACYEDRKNEVEARDNGLGFEVTS